MSVGGERERFRAGSCDNVLEIEGGVGDGEGGRDSKKFQGGTSSGTVADTFAFFLRFAG